MTDRDYTVPNESLSEVDRVFGHVTRAGAATDVGDAPTEAGTATDVDARLGAETAACPLAERDSDAVDEASRVERRASDGGERDTALSGELAPNGFPRLLTQIAAERRTGSLVVRATGGGSVGPTPTKVVFFTRGVPVFVQSNVASESLGQILVRGGVLTVDSLAMTLEEARQRGQRLGEELTRTGLLSPGGLRDALAEQLQEKLFGLFAWRDGRYSFREGDTPPDGGVTLEMGLAEVVYEGVVRSVPPAQLLDLLAPDLGAYVIPDRRATRAFEQLALSSEVRAMLAQIDGTQTLVQALRIAEPRPGSAAQALFAMRAIGAIHFEATPHHVPELEESTDEAEIEPLAEAGNPAALREALERIARALREGRVEAALGLDGRPDAVTLRLARRKLLGRIRPYTLPGEAPRELRMLAMGICARLTREDKSRPSSSQRAPASDDAPPTKAGRRGSRTRGGDTSEVDLGVRELLEAERLFNDGQAELRQGRAAAATVLLARATELCPDEPDFLVLLGLARCLDAATGTGDGEAGLADVTRARALAPDSARVHVIAARALSACNRPEEARQAARRAAALEPEDREVQRVLADLSVDDP